MFCPHCGHQNEPESARCAGCQQELAIAATSTDEGLVKCPKCGYANPWDATQCHGCLARLETQRLLEVLDPPAQATPAKWLGAAIAVVAGVIVLAQMGRLFTTPPAQPAVPAAQAQAPAAPVQPGTAPSAQTPSAQPVPADDDPAPEIQYKLAMSWVQRKRPAQARDAFEELLQKYPNSRFAADARTQLEQLGGGTAASGAAAAPPAEPFSASEDLAAELQYRVGMNWLSRHDAAKARLAFEEVVKKYPSSSYAREARTRIAQLPVAAPPAPAKTVAQAAPPKIGPPANTITNEDFRRLGSRPTSGGSPAANQARPQAPAPAAPAPGERTLPSLGDRLSLVSSEVAGDKLIMALRYQLALGKSRKVYAAARVVFPEPNPPVFAYSGETFQNSTGTVVVQVPLTPQMVGQKPLSVRLMMFETGGAMFYSQDIPWP